MRGHKTIQRIQAALKVPSQQPKRGRIRLLGGSCVRPQATYKDHVWAYDFG